MDESMQEKIERAVVATNRIIAESSKELQKAIRREEWGRAATLKSFISGMNQTLVIFDQALGS